MQFSNCQGWNEGDKSGISLRDTWIEEMTSGVKRRCATNNENESRKQFSSVSGWSISPAATYVHRMAVHNSFTLIRGEHECLSLDIIVRDKNDGNEIYTGWVFGVAHTSTCPPNHRTDRFSRENRNFSTDVYNRPSFLRH